MMLTFKAKLGTEFFYDPNLTGEVWIIGRVRSLCATPTVVIPARDLLDFCRHASGIPAKGSRQETDELMRILDSCGVFDRKQSRGETRRKLHARMAR